MQYRSTPPNSKQEGDEVSETFLFITCIKRNGRPNVGGVSLRRRNGAPSRKGCVVNGQLTKARNKRVRPVPAPSLLERDASSMSKAGNKLVRPPPTNTAHLICTTRTGVCNKINGTYASYYSSTYKLLHVEGAAGVLESTGSISGEHPSMLPAVAAFCTTDNIPCTPMYFRVRYLVSFRFVFFFFFFVKRPHLIGLQIVCVLFTSNRSSYTRRCKSCKDSMYFCLFEMFDMFQP